MRQASQRKLTELLEFDFATAIDALDYWAAKAPGRKALHEGETGRVLTYGEFAAATDSVAAFLVSEGVQAKDAVGVFSTRPLASALAMYGIWKAGAVYAPVNFQYEGDLLAYQLNDAAPKLLLVDHELVARVGAIESQLGSQVPQIVIGGNGLEGLEALLKDAMRPSVTISSHDPANIIYTSGTTGPSKGVIQSHRWVNGYTWAGRRILTEDDVVYNDLPMYHVGGAHFNVTRALWCGASVSLWERFSPSQFWDRIRAGGCTAAVLLDVMTPWLLNAPASASDKQNSLNKVHMQPLPANHHEFAKRFGIDFVSSGFGQSETGASLMVLIDELADGEGTPAELYRGLARDSIRQRFAASGLPVLPGEQSIPKGLMGSPAPFMEVSILDDLDREVEPGEVGQLAMRPKLPALMFDEYLAKPKATVAAWRNLWFHTGDAAVRESDDMFSYVDRLGDRIRVRGENISSFHIEELLGQHDSVQLAAAIAVPSAEGDEDDVIAFIEVAEGRVFDAKELAEYCSVSMPRYMRPRAFLEVAEVPRTPTNKIEKYKLRKQWTERN